MSSSPDVGHQLAAAAHNLPTVVTHDMQLATREAAANIWDAGVLEPANRLRNFQTYSREAGNQAGSSARWQAQSNTTETHSELVMLCAQLCVHDLR